MNKFTPTKLDEFLISDNISRMALDMILNGKYPFPNEQNAICFHGIPGTGKTTLACALPGMLENSGNLAKCPRTGGPASQLFSGTELYQFTSCDGSAGIITTIKNIRNHNLNDAYAAPSGWHYEILDEVDTLSKESQRNLRSVITHSKYTIFIMTCNDVQKLEPGFKDRSLLIEMNQCPLEQYVTAGKRFLQTMQLTGNEIPEDMLKRFALASRGSMRQFIPQVRMHGLSHGGCP